MKILKVLGKSLLSVGRLAPYLLTLLVLVLALRGIPGNPDVAKLNTSSWKDAGPFDTSPERGRFALVYSIVEEDSFSYTLPVARFAIPDIGYHNGSYVSLFAPGSAIVLIPGYLIGKFLGSSQIGTYAVILLFAFLNFLLIKAISRILGASSNSSFVSALSFTFASTAFAYAVNLYQHHLSVFLLLTSFYSLLKFSPLKSLSITWFLFPLSLAIDYPNAFLFSPLLVYSLIRLVNFRKLKNNLAISLNLKYLLLIPLFSLSTLLFFFWVHDKSYGNPLQLAGTVKNIRSIDENGLPAQPDNSADPNTSAQLEKLASQRSALSFFNTRNLVNGMNILIFSPDRGVINYWPLVIIAFFGVAILYQKHQKVAVLILSVFITNLLIYSSWGDPWGGWSFGPRYLIPGFAFLSVAISQYLNKFKTKPLLLLLFTAVFSYSLYVNTAGALTSVSNPPQVEVLSLEEQTGQEQKYTFERNLDHLENNRSKALYFRQTYSENFSAHDYFKIVLSIVSVIALTHTIKIYLEKDTYETNF
ncbi:MAG: hypothetical protein ACOX6N_03045 [Patescibacteria group bacterium]|jgi:hypothetical protein